MTVFIFQKQAVEKFKNIQVLHVSFPYGSHVTDPLRFPITLIDLSLAVTGLDLSSLPNLIFLKKLALVGEHLSDNLLNNIVVSCLELQYIELIRKFRNEFLAFI